jgi:D-glycero-alpha-D-manno-heptose 1-phosphate guanylyltransferase
MEAIILAGGFGTRLRQVVPDVPKPMAPIGDRPFLEILLRSLAANGFQRVILSLGFLADSILDHFGSSFAGMDLCPVIENSPLGTGGAVRLAMMEIASDHAYVFNGDTYLDLEIAAVETQWSANHRSIIIGREVDDAHRYGRLMRENGQVTGFVEKGLSGPGLINAGCYVLPRAQLDAFQPGQPFSLEQDFLVPLVRTDKVDLFVTEGEFIDIGIPEDYWRAQTLLASLHR